jgi:glycosyltransferase involved in cell wall biosynthesis
MITVAFDPQIFLLQRQGGISRYFAELIRQFRDHPELGINPVLISNSVINLHALNTLSDLSLQSPKGKLQPWRELCASLTQTSNSSTWDIVHHTYYIGPFLLKYNGSIKVSTLHDMIPESEFKQRYRPNPHLQKSNYMKNSDLIISVSQATLDAAIAHYKFDIATKAQVIHHGVNSSGSLEQKNKMGYCSAPYVLYVGKRNGYKDARTLLQAFSEIQSSHELILVGGGPMTEDEKDLVADLQLDGKVKQVNVHDLELTTLYANASALVITSLLEGFGLTVLEAMSTGCPVISANTSSLPEVGGNAALYFQPGNVSELSRALKQVLLSSEIRASMAINGIRRAEELSWHRCAKATASAYISQLEKK